MNRKPIFLIGARGAGKTTVGKMLAESIGYSFVDTDDIICERAQLAVQEIVANHGWKGFRKLEQEVLQECGKLEQTVVATGGGAVLHGSVWEKLDHASVIVWLEVAVDNLIARIMADDRNRENRPSLTGADVTEEFHAVYAERAPLYEKTAHVVIDADRLDRAAIVADIVSKINFTDRERNK